MKITSDIRGGTKQSLISLSKPHQAVSKHTIGRWIRLVFKRCNIDIRSYGAYSTRTASTSIAIKKLPVFDVLKSAGWRNVRIFAKFYHLNVESEESNFGKYVIDNYSASCNK